MPRFFLRNQSALDLRADVNRAQQDQTYWKY
jgi:hypothetical protein